MSRRSLTAYNIFFQEERRRLLEGPSENSPKQRKSLGRNGKIDFSELAHVVASNWKGLAPEEKIPYGKLAAFQQSQMEKYYKQPTSSSPTWDKKHVKQQSVMTLPPSPTKFANNENSPVWVEDDDDMVLEEVVEDVMKEIEAGISTSDADKEENINSHSPTFWPLMGKSTPIADYIRCCRYPQHALQHTHTCMPCTTTISPITMMTTTMKHCHSHHHWKCSQSDVVFLSQSLEAEGRDFCLQALLGDDGDDDSVKV